MSFVIEYYYLLNMFELGFNFIRYDISRFGSHKLFLRLLSGNHRVSHPGRGPC